MTMTTDPPLPIDDSDYVLFPSVKHPQGRERAFSDAFKALDSHEFLLGCHVANPFVLRAFLLSSN